MEPGPSHKPDHAGGAVSYAALAKKFQLIFTPRRPPPNSCPSSPMTGRFRLERQAGVAFLEAIRDLGVGHMLPPLGVSEMLPAMLRVENGALTADRSHGPVTLNALHCDLPAIHHAHSLR